MPNLINCNFHLSCRFSKRTTTTILSNMCMTIRNPAMHLNENLLISQYFYRIVAKHKHVHHYHLKDNLLISQFLIVAKHNISAIYEGKFVFV
jgi:hypothetical protein